MDGHKFGALGSWLLIILVWFEGWEGQLECLSPYKYKGWCYSACLSGR